MTLTHHKQEKYLRFFSSSFCIGLFESSFWLNLCVVCFSLYFCWIYTIFIPAVFIVSPNMLHSHSHSRIVDTIFKFNVQIKTQHETQRIKFSLFFSVERGCISCVFFLLIYNKNGLGALGSVLTTLPKCFIAFEDSPEKCWICCLNLFQTHFFYFIS